MSGTLVTATTNQTAAERWALAELSSSQIPTQGVRKDSCRGAARAQACLPVLVRDPGPDVQLRAGTLSSVIANRPFAVMAGSLVVQST